MHGLEETVVGALGTLGTQGTADRLVRRDLVLLRLEQQRRETQRRRSVGGVPRGRFTPRTSRQPALDLLALSTR